MPDAPRRGQVQSISAKAPEPDEDGQGAVDQRQSVRQDRDGRRDAEEVTGQAEAALRDEPAGCGHEAATRPVSSAAGITLAASSSIRSLTFAVLF